MTDKSDEPKPLDPPKRTDLPYFAYGLFKPGELAYGQIADFLEGAPVEEQVPGALYVRDGLPLLSPGGRDPVIGYLLRFREDKVKEAYAKICAFEPRKHYRWETVRLEKTGATANALLGSSPEKGSIRDEEGVWAGRRDPVLATGLAVVREVSDRDAREEFASAPPDDFDWPRLFRLQMAYLFLWTIIERYAMLRYGPTLGPMQKVRKFGEDPAFERALKRVVTRRGRVHDSRNPKNHASLDPEHPINSAKYYYYVRSNLSHRGKGAYNDGEIVRCSLLELQEVVGLVLEERLGPKIKTRNSI